jgi:hypothetical protein
VIGLSTSSQEVGLRLLAVIIGALMIGSALTACGSDEAREATPLSSGVLDRRIADLPQGASLAVVEARLGEPESEVSVGNETVLSYVPWRLIAEDGRLKRRIRSRPTGGQVGASEPSERESEVLDQKILAIKPGTSIANVRGMLGVPEHNEEVFEGVRHPEVVLSYGAWLLSFRNGHLKQRTKF